MNINKIKEALYKTRWAGEFNENIWESDENYFLREETLPAILEALPARQEPQKSAEEIGHEVTAKIMVEIDPDTKLPKILGLEEAYWEIVYAIRAERERK